MKTRRKRFSILGILLLTAACGSSEDTKSTNVTNEGIQAKFSVTEAGSSRARLVAELNVGGSNGTNIELVDGEYIEVTANDSNVELEKDTDFFDIDYEARLPVGDAETDITFNLYRTDQPDVLGTKVTLAAGFNITQPAEDEILYSAANTQVIWTIPRANQLMRLEIQVNCQAASGEAPIITSRKLSIDDDGFYELNFGDMVINQNDQIDRSRNCSVDLSAIRETRGTLAEAFGEGGSIKAYRERSLKNLILIIDG